MNTGSLVDFLQRYVNSIGAATALYAQSGDPLALDVVLDNNAAIDVIIYELKSRQKEGTAFAPPPDLHLQELTEKFLKRQAERSFAEPS